MRTKNRMTIISTMENDSTILGMIHNNMNTTYSRPFITEMLKSHNTKTSPARIEKIYCILNYGSEKQISEIIHKESTINKTYLAILEKKKRERYISLNSLESCIIERMDILYNLLRNDSNLNDPLDGYIYLIEQLYMKQELTYSDLRKIANTMNKNLSSAKGHKSILTNYLSRVFLQTSPSVFFIQNDIIYITEHFPTKNDE